MRHSSLINAFFILKRSGNKTMALWDTAEPISLDELKAKFAVLTGNELVYKPEQTAQDSDAMRLEELWKIFESLEELEDCSLTEVF